MTPLKNGTTLASTPLLHRPYFILLCSLLLHCLLVSVWTSAICPRMCMFLRCCIPSTKDSAWHTGAFNKIFFLLSFFRATPQHMEVPRLVAESALQLLAYATAIAQGNVRSLTY